MKRSLRNGIAIGISAIVVVVLAYFFFSNRRQVVQPPFAGTLSPGVRPDDTLPTAEFLKVHPEALAEAQRRCDAGEGQDAVALCDVVHSAKASLMADKFRQGAGGGSK